jgi:Protein of unknown function (DUF4236)
MPVRARSRARFGPLYLNITDRGITSVTLRLGPASWRLWSRAGRRRGLSSVNLPGPFTWTPPARGRTVAERAAAHRRALRRRAVLAVAAVLGLLTAAAHGADGRVLVALAAVAAVAGVGYLRRRRRMP